MLLDNIFVIIPVIEPDLNLLTLVNSLKNTNSKIIIVSLRDFVGKNELLLELQNYAIVLNCRRHNSYDNAIYTALNYIYKLYDSNLTVLTLPVNGHTDFEDIINIVTLFNKESAQLIIKDSINNDAVPSALTLFSYFRFRYINIRYKADLSYSDSCLCVYDGSLIPLLIKNHQYSYLSCFRKKINILQIHGDKHIAYPSRTTTVH